jgi:hypothetical protein
MEPQAPDAPVEPIVTDIPVTPESVPEVETPAEDVSEPVSEPVEEVTPEVAPVEPDAPAPDAVPDVAGTPVLDTTPAEPVVQEPAPNPVPATAAPSQDAVSLNAHLESVQTQLQGVVDYCKNFLSSHPVADTVVADVEVLVQTVKNALVL